MDTGDSTESGRKPHIVSHTSLRGIAALIVVGYHLTFSASVAEHEALSRLFYRGYLFVDLFFIMSGYVLSYVYRPDSFSSWSTIRRFYASRIARIYPLHVLALALVVLFKVGTIAFAVATDRPEAIYQAPWDALPSHLLLLQAWGPSADTWNIPAWSISAEVFAYLLFPVIALLFSRFVVARLAALLFALAFYGAIGAWTGDLDIVSGVSIARCLAGFSTGMLLHGASRPWQRIGDRSLSSLQVLAVVLIGCGVELGRNDVLLILPFALLVIGTTPDRGVVARMLRRAWLRRLGDWSYSIYLLHVPVLLGLSFFFSRFWNVIGVEEGGVTRLLFVVIAYAITLTASRFTFEYWEKPLRVRLGRLLRGRDSAPRPRRRIVPAP